MLRFLAGRLVHGGIVVAFVSILAFALLESTPGDFFDAARLSPELSRSTADALRARFGQDRPIAARYVLWVESALRGDLGISFAYNLPVIELLRTRAANTLLLTVTAVLLAWLIAVPWGVWSAAHAGGWPDRIGSLLVAVMLALPDLVLALLLLFLAVSTGWFPAGGMLAPGAAQQPLWLRSADLLRHLMLPAVVLAAATIPPVWRHTRAAVRETLSAPFVAAAVTHGIPRGRLLFRHVLPAASNPILSLSGIAIGGLLSSSLLVEAVFGWPGLGPLLFEAIGARDLHVIVGAVLASAVFLVAGTMIADILLYTTDPRIGRH